MNARLLLLVCCLLWSGLPVAGGYAQSLKERKIQQNEDQMLAEQIAYTNQVCRSNIEASVDWQSFSASGQPSGAAPVNACDVAFGAIESICADETGQEAVRRHVDRVVCRKGAMRDVDLREGTLFFQVDNSLGDDFVFVREYLTGKMAGADSGE